MKKIFISFFVFGLMFFVGHFVNAQQVNASPETVLTEASGQSGLDNPDITEPETYGQPYTSINSPTSSDWVPVGISGFSPGTAKYTSFGIDSNNVQYVAYRDDANGGSVIVVRFNGTNWVTIGNLGYSSGFESNISLAIDLNNVPYVAFTDSANNNNIKVMKWGGANWTTVGNLGFSGSSAFYASLAINSSNIPYVTYVDFANNQKATVKKFDNSSNTWVDLGNSDFSVPSRIAERGNIE